LTAQGSTWFRCPKCGRASLPPDDTALSRRERTKPDPLSGVFVTGPGDSPRMTPGRPATAGRRAAGFGNVRQLVLVSGLFLALLILLVSLLDQNRISAFVFGFAALGFVGFLLLPTTRGKS
jgi:hypothetical protein